MCPHCGKNAPLRFDAGGARCSACGAPRLLVGGAPLSLAGEPQRIGGLVASGLGWFVLLGGLASAALIGGVGLWLFATLAVAKFVALPLATLTTLVGGSMLLGGRRLKKRAARSLRKAQVGTLQGVASLQGGGITVPQAARALKIPEPAADALLTELAIAEVVRQELTDQGTLLYSFQRAPSPDRLRAPAAPLRVPPPRPGQPADEDIEELEAIVEPPRTHRKAVG